MNAARVTPIALAIWLLGGCDDSEGPVGPAPGHSQHEVAAVQLDAPATSLEMGETVQLAASVTCEHGIELNREVTWSTTNKAIATVDADGLLKGWRPGGIEVRAAVANRTAAAAMTVTGAFVGPEGRTLVSPDGIVTLEIPPGALTEMTEFIGLPAGEPDIPTDPGYVANTAYECLPHGLQFQERVRIRIRFDPAHVPPGYQVEQLRLRHRERNQFQWRDGDQNQVIAGENEVTAEIDGLSYFALIAVPAGSGQADVIRITGLTTPYLTVGDVVTLNAKVFDKAGKAHPEWEATWSSDDESVATVDQKGRVEAVGVGFTNINASYGGITRGVSVLVSAAQPPGGHTAGNNLSYPVIFAEGIGLVGDAVTVDAGLRPTPDEGIVVDALPFWYSGNTPDYQGQYYMQKGTNVWQADWEDGSTSSTAYQSIVYWGDNLTHKTWNTHSMIRIEHVLEDLAGTTLEGFNMYPLYGTGKDEMQGTDGTMDYFVPTLYSVVPRLKIEKIDAEGGTPVFTAFDGAIHEYIGSEGPGGYSAEVNVAGKIIFGYNFMVRNVAKPPDGHKYGWWRITFSLDDQGTVGGNVVARNLTLDQLGSSSHIAAPPTPYTPYIDPANNVTWLDIYIEQASGGGGGGGGGHQVP